MPVSTVVAEISARTVFEGSINFIYTTLDDIPTRLCAQLNDYLLVQIQKADQWEKRVESLYQGEKEIHISAIQERRLALDLYRRTVNSHFKPLGVDPTSKRSWGSLLDRAEAIGAAIDYRTIYRALCSQTHHDAEDLLNLLVLEVHGRPDLTAHLLKETANFSWLGVTYALKLYGTAVHSYLSAFSLDGTDLVDGSRRELEQLAFEAAEKYPISNSPASAYGDATVQALVEISGEVREQNLARRREFLNFELTPEEEARVRMCEKCGDEYQIEETKDHGAQYFKAPYDYEQGCQTICLACWLGVGPND